MFYSVTYDTCSKNLFPKNTRVDKLDREYID